MVVNVECRIVGVALEEGESLRLFGSLWGVYRRLSACQHVSDGV